MTDVEDKHREHSCYYNDSVICTSKLCTRCGWNPLTLEMRKRRTRERLKAERYSDGIIRIRRAKNEGDL